jgi:hypothetical protein
MYGTLRVERVSPEAFLYAVFLLVLDKIVLVKSANVWCAKSRGRVFLTPNVLPGSRGVGGPVASSRGLCCRRAFLQC